MVHKSNIIPGLSNFIDKTILAQYPPTSLKRIAAAGALALYLNNNSTIVDNLLNNPFLSGLNISNDQGMIDLDLLRNIYKPEIAKAGYLRMHFPLLGDVDFTVDDIDTLYDCIRAISAPSPAISNNMVSSVQGGL
jgi:hypothetical protein